MSSSSYIADMAAPIGRCVSCENGSRNERRRMMMRVPPPRHWVHSPDRNRAHATEDVREARQMVSSRGGNNRPNVPRHANKEGNDDGGSGAPSPAPVPPGTRPNGYVIAATTSSPSSPPSSSPSSSCKHAISVDKNMTRLNYDEGAYKQNLMQSVGPGRYHIGAPTQECQECFPQDPRTALGSVGNAKCVDRPLIDVDSELQGITRRASKDPKCAFNPSTSAASPPCRMKKVPACRDFHVVAEDTRLSNPPCTLRGSDNGFNRWEPLCRNPQLNVDLPFDSLINNRLVVKDNHRPVLPKPLNQANVLPPDSTNDSQISIMPSCSSPIPPNFPNVFWNDCENVY